MIYEEKCVVTSNKKVAHEHYLMTLKTDKIALKAKPGQFVSILCGEGTFLRRPMSICYANSDKKIKILYKVVGKGTDLLSKKKKNNVLNVLGPIGNGFNIDKKARNIFLVGGGTGIAPIYFLSRELEKQNKNPIILIGAKTKEYVLLEKEFMKGESFFEVSTEDGSYGHKGDIITNLEDYVQNIEADQIFMAGPAGMYKAAIENESMKKVLQDTPVQVTLEEKMGCGIGTCMGCVVNVIENGEKVKKRVCKDGPIFNLKDVVFDDK